MLLFLTLEALFKFSIDERFVGAGEASRLYGLLFSRLGREGEAGSRPCQK